MKTLVFRLGVFCHYELPWLILNIAACNKNHVTSIIIPDQKSMAVLKTHKVVCSAAVYGQACFHYYSAIKNGKSDDAESVFTCTDDQKRYTGSLLTATHQWKTEHNEGSTWSSYMTNQYVFAGANARTSAIAPRCQVDEWPMAYFRSPRKNGQLVRWLPGSENQGAGQLWAKFCDNNDGGYKNGQTRDGKLDQDLVKTLNRLATSTKVNGATTTTYDSYSAEFTRAVFSIDFDWNGGPLEGKIPDDSNDWGLRLNPCWPQAIVPDDPGFVLKSNDPWYDKHIPKPDHRHEYSLKRIPQTLVDDAKDWMKAHPKFTALAAKAPQGQKRSAPSNNNNNNNAPNKRPNETQPNESQSNKTEPSQTKPDEKASSGSKNQKRFLDRVDDKLVDDKLVARERNVTHEITDEEILRNVEIIHCADRTCSQEQELYDERDGVLVIPGPAPAMSPPEDVEAIPTRAAQVVMEAKMKIPGRQSAPPKLPAATTPPSL